MKQPAPDLIVAGKYCLERQLAAGGMGSVWVARHLDLDLDIAIKFMDPECASEEGRIRFELEAKAAAHLQSPYVVNVLDYGVDEDLPYIVMELLNGEDLENRLQREGRVSLESAQKILNQAAKALRRAQELGVVHRDIKPHNLFLSKGDSDDEDNEETLKILDFGIAKETGPALVGEGTNTGHIVGSPNYMSPEHVRGAKDIDSRSDLWSLGVVLFQATTGRLPFPGDVVGDVIGMILADPIPRATDIAPDLPPGIDDFFFKALQRDRSLRFQSAKEMNDAFAELVRTSMPPGGVGPTSFPAARQARADAPTLSLEEVAAKAAITAAVPNEDTLTKNAVSDTLPARASSMRVSVMAAATGLIVTFGVVFFLLRMTEPKADDPSVAAAAAAAASGAPSSASSGQSPQAGAGSPDPSQQGAGSAPASGQQGAGTQPAGLRPNSLAGPAGASASGQSSADTAPSETPSATPAPTHVAGAPAFDVSDNPATSKPTTKTGTKTGTKSTAKPAGSGTPSWGF